MEVKVIDEKLEVFQPKTLEINIQSQEELDFFRALFSWLPVDQVMRDYARAASGQIESALTRSGGVNHSASGGIRKQLQDAVEK